METFTQPKVPGYRQLNEAEAALMTEVKQHAEHTRELIQRVQTYLNSQEHETPPPQATNPHRWLAMGASDLQVGFMQVVRAIAQPTTF